MKYARAVFSLHLVSERSRRQINKEMQDLKQYLQGVGYSKASVIMVVNCVSDFLFWLNKEVEFILSSSVSEAERGAEGKVSSEDIRNYHHHLQTRPNKRRSGGLSESYIHHHIYSLKLYFSYLQKTGKIQHNPMGILQFKSPQTKSRKILTQQEIKRLYKATESAKERAVLSLFYGCGLRRTEGEKLNLDDVHFSSGLLFVRKGKGGKRRVVPMGEKVKLDLQTYAENDRPSPSQEKAFMLNKQDTRMSGASYNRILKSLLSRSRIKKSISLHNLRHSIATHLLESGLSVEYVRDFLGHQHLESTQIYTKVSSKQLKKL